jgi:fimbrial chaperone protein
MKVFSRTYAIVLLMLAITSPVFAFKLTPIEAEFAPGRLAVQTFKLENQGTQPIAVEIRVQARDMAMDGSDQLTSSADTFVVYPDQVVMNPGATQSVRVQWTGTQAPSKEQAFRLIAEQLPIELDANGAERSGLRLMVKYLAALYVRPPNPEARLSARMEPSGTKASGSASLVLHNEGNAHVIVRSEMVEVLLDGSPIEMTAAQREAVHGRNVLASRERRMELPWASNFEGGALSVRLKAPRVD